jgi:hypothetical protein
VSVPAPNEVSVERLEVTPPFGDAQPMALKDDTKNRHSQPMSCSIWHSPMDMDYASTLVVLLKSSQHYDLSGIQWIFLYY